MGTGIPKAGIPKAGKTPHWDSPRDRDSKARDSEVRDSESTLTLQPFVFFLDKSKGIPEKSKGYSRRGTLKSLENRGKRPQKARKIGKQKKQGNQKSKDKRRVRAGILKLGIPKTSRFTAPLIQTPLRLPLIFFGPSQILKEDLAMLKPNGPAEGRCEFLAISG